MRPNGTSFDGFEALLKRVMPGKANATPLVRAKAKRVEPRILKIWKTKVRFEHEDRVIDGASERGRLGRMADALYLCTSKAAGIFVAISYPVVLPCYNVRPVFQNRCFSVIGPRT